MDPAAVRQTDAMVSALIQQGGFAVLALVMVVAYRRTAEVLIQVVRENTASNAELVTLIRELHDVLIGSARDRGDARGGR